MYTLDFISFRVYPPPLKLRNRDQKHFRVTTFLIVNNTLSDNFSLMHIWLKYNKQAKQSRFWISNMKISSKNPKKCVSFSRIFIFLSEHFSCKEKICLRNCPSIASKNCLNYSAHMKQVLKHSDVYFRFY